MSPADETLAVRNLHVHYGETCALREVDFTARAGRTVAVVGRNGAGKSTLLKAIAGLIPGAAGSVLWNGAPLVPSLRRRLVAYLPQREAVDWDFPLTVRGLAEMGLYPVVGTWGRFTASHRAAVEAVLRRMGLEDLGNRRIGELSGGQQQRAFLARAVVGGARILLLDEPLAGLDATAAGVITALLRDLAGEGALVVASHHDLGSIEEAFDDLLLLRTRQLVFGPVSETLGSETMREAFA